VLGYAIYQTAKAKTMHNKPSQAYYADGRPNPYWVANSAKAKPPRQWHKRPSHNYFGPFDLMADALRWMRANGRKREVDRYERRTQGPQ
jgi:hypothetical protein